MEKIELSTDTLNALLAYIGTQPYNQVKPLFDRIQRELTPTPPAPQPVPEKKKA